MAKTVKATVKLDVSDAIKEAKKIGTALERSLKEAITSVKRSEKEFLQLVGALRKVTTEGKLTESQLKALSIVAEANVQAGRRLDATFSKTRTRLQNVGQEAAKTEKKVKKLKEAQTLTQKATKLLNTTLARATGQAAYDLLVNAITKVKDVIISTINEAVEFESTFTGVGKTVDDVFRKTAEGTFELTRAGEQLRDNLLEISRVVPIAVNELNKIAETAGQLGVARKDIALFTDTVARIGVTTNLSAEKAAIALAKLQTVLRLDITEVRSLADSIVALGNNTATTEEVIVKFSQRISGAAATVGLAAPDVAGIAAAFESIGAQSTASATAVQKTLLTIQQAVVEGGDKLEVFAETAGRANSQLSDPVNFSNAFRTEPVEVLTSFIEGLGVAGEEAIVILGQLGLGDARLIRSTLAVANAQGLLRDTIELSNKANEDQTALLDESELRFQTAQSAIDEYKNSVTELKVAASDTGTIKGFYNLLTRQVTGVTDLTNAQDDYNKSLSQLVNISRNQLNVELPRDQRGARTLDREDVTFSTDDIREIARVAFEARNELRSVDLDSTGRIQVTADAISTALLIFEGSVDKSADALSRLPGLSATTAQGLKDLTDTALLTDDTLLLIAQAVGESGLSFAELTTFIQQTEVALALAATGLDRDTRLLNLVTQAVIDGTVAFADLPIAVRQAIGEFDIFSDQVDKLAQVEGESADRAFLLANGLDATGIAAGRTAEEQLELNFQFLLGQGYTEEVARAILDYDEAMRIATGGLNGMSEEQQALNNLIVETTKSFVDGNDAVAQAIINFVELRATTDGNTDSLLGFVAATGLLTPSQRLMLDNTVALAEKQQELQLQVDLAGKDIAVAAEELENFARTLQMAWLESEIAASVAADLAKTYLDGGTAAEKLTQKLIDQAVASGATVDQIVMLTDASEELTVAEKETIVATVKLAQEERRLIALYNNGNITLAAAEARLNALTVSLGLAESATAGLASTSGTFVSAITEVETATGGARQEIEETTEDFRTFFVELLNGSRGFDEIIDAFSNMGQVIDENAKTFRDFFVEVVGGTEDFGKIGEETEDWSRQLLDLAIAAGASVDEIIALGIATGQFSEEQAQQLLNFAVAQKGIEQIADAYVTQGLTAERAAEAVATLSEQIAEGAKIDLTAFGITPADLSAQALAVEDGIGLAGESISNFKDELIDFAIAAGASIDQILLLGVATGKFSSEQAKQLLSFAVAQKGVEQIAEAYVTGALSADKAAEAVSTLSNQITEGADIDLAEFGITVSGTGDDLVKQAEQVKEVTRSSGGAATAVNDWKDELLEFAGTQDVSTAALLRLARETGNYTEEVLNTGLQQDITTRAIEAFTDLIARGFDPTKAIDGIGRLRDSLTSLTTDELAQFIDLGIEFDLDPRELQASIDTFLAGGITARAAVELQLEVDVKETRLIDKLEKADREFELLVTGDTSDVARNVDELDDDALVLNFEADTSAVENRIESITGQTYELDTELSIDSAVAQAQLDALNLTVDVDVNLGDFDTSELPNNVGSSGTGGGLLARDGGLVTGASHENGGVLIEAEGGEFIVNRSGVTAETEPLLRSINSFGNDGLPEGILNQLDRIASQQIALPDEFNMPEPINGTGGIFDIPFMGVPTVPTPIQTSTDQSVAIDQSSRTTITNIINNNFGAAGAQERVTPSLNGIRI